MTSTAPTSACRVSHTINATCFASAATFDGCKVWSAEVALPAGCVVSHVGNTVFIDGKPRVSSCQVNHRDSRHCVADAPVIVSLVKPQVNDYRRRIVG